MPKVMNLHFKEKEKKHRYSLEIVRDMLLIASEKARKTRIMYQANLSYRVMEKYLKSLLTNGLIECGHDSSYLITERGKEFLEKYDDYVERRRRIGEEIKGVTNERSLLENMCFNNENEIRQIVGRRLAPA